VGHVARMRKKADTHIHKVSESVENKRCLSGKNYTLFNVLLFLCDWVFLITLKIEPICPYGMLTLIYQTIWHHVQEILKHTVFIFGLHVKQGEIFTITNKI
jgi:hypothetical protein